MSWPHDHAAPARWPRPCVPPPLRSLGLRHERNATSCSGACGPAGGRRPAARRPAARRGWRTYDADHGGARPRSRPPSAASTRAVGRTTLAAPDRAARERRRRSRTVAAAQEWRAPAHSKNLSRSRLGIGQIVRAPVDVLPAQGHDIALATADQQRKADDVRLLSRARRSRAGEMIQRAMKLADFIVREEAGQFRTGVPLMPRAGFVRRCPQTIAWFRLRQRRFNALLASPGVARPHSWNQRVTSAREIRSSGTGPKSGSRRLAMALACAVLVDGLPRSKDALPGPAAKSANVGPVRPVRLPARRIAPRSRWRGTWRELRRRLSVLPVPV